jgi:hypothetical protein
MTVKAEVGVIKAMEVVIVEEIKTTLVEKTRMMIREKTQILRTRLMLLMKTIQNLIQHRKFLHKKQTEQTYFLLLQRWPIPKGQPLHPPQHLRLCGDSYLPKFVVMDKMTTVTEL